MESQPVYFFTATILKWLPLLESDKYKNIIIDSMSYLVSKNRCRVFGFVIMPNHLHLLWQMCGSHKKENVQRDFLKFTGQMMLMDLKANDPKACEPFFVNLRDRKYQLWKRKSLSVEMFGREVMEQKLDYIHNDLCMLSDLLFANMQYTFCCMPFSYLYFE